MVETEHRLKKNGTIKTDKQQNNKTTNKQQTTLSTTQKF